MDLGIAHLTRVDLLKLKEGVVLLESRSSFLVLLSKQRRLLLTGSVSLSSTLEVVDSSTPVVLVIIKLDSYR